MTIHVRVHTTGDLPSPDNLDAVELVKAGQIELRHEECIVGKMSIRRSAHEQGWWEIECDVCNAHDSIGYTALVQALRRTLLRQEEVKCGTLGIYFLPQSRFD